MEIEPVPEALRETERDVWALPNPCLCSECFGFARPLTRREFVESYYGDADVTEGVEESWRTACCDSSSVVFICEDGAVIISCEPKFTSSSLALRMMQRAQASGAPTIQPVA